ncbi:MAG TPA: hypothetical protein VMC43_01050 [Candidatus Paceibacterota bacterium]|nr:hypothetical protein [Candidatus Paceibacterota bacterium]
MTLWNRFQHSYKKSPRLWASGLFLLALLIVAGALAYLGFYPIAFVNGSVIWARTYQENYRYAGIYYQNLRRAAATQTTTVPIADLSSKDLEVAVLNALVTRALVDQAAGREIGSDLDQMVNEKLANYENDQQLQMGAQTLYGMPYPDFRSEILVPQARADLLSARLYLRGVSMDNWLSDSLSKAKVTILSSDFHWDGAKVVAN